MAEDEVVADLFSTGILSHIPAPDLETLKFYGVFGEFGVGENVIAEGTLQDRLYFVISGKLEVSVDSGGQKVVLGEMGPGDCIGEVSVFEPGPASATVSVVETVVLWHIDVAALQTFFEAIPAAGGSLLLGIAQLLSRRLRQANAAIIANRVLPKHLSVRSGGLREPIKAENLPVEKGGLLKGLFGMK
jgi:CRP/FNR family cyclic AMP-dependent transcriptional regulator